MVGANSSLLNVGYPFLYRQQEGLVCGNSAAGEHDGDSGWGQEGGRTGGGAWAKGS